MYKVSISKGNEKIGETINVSLMPVASCPAGVPCARKCYARRICARRPNIHQAWRKNWKIVQENMAEYFGQIEEALKKARKKEYFRWHVGGDIPSQEYLEGMKELARKFPQTKFLVFTKNFALDFSNIPSNLVIVASEWGQYKAPAELPRSIFWPKGTEKPAEGFVCPGNCETCRYCWYMKSGEAVVFAEH